MVKSKEEEKAMPDLLSRNVIRSAQHDLLLRF